MKGAVVDLCVCMCVSINLLRLITQQAAKAKEQATTAKELTG